MQASKYRRKYCKKHGDHLDCIQGYILGNKFLLSESKMSGTEWIRPWFEYTQPALHPSLNPAFFWHVSHDPWTRILSFLLPKDYRSCPLFFWVDLQRVFDQEWEPWMSCFSSRACISKFQPAHCHISEPSRVFGSNRLQLGKWKPKKTGTSCKIL